MKFKNILLVYLFLKKFQYVEFMFKISTHKWKQFVILLIFNFVSEEQRAERVERKLVSSLNVVA